FLIGLVVGGFCEALGAVPVFGVGAAALRQTFGRRPIWFIVLLVGVLAPLLGAAIVIVLAYAAESQFGQLAPSVDGVSVLLLEAGAAPVVAAIVCAIYAASALRLPLRVSKGATT